ncbi:MAG: hypothetical protein RL213_72 [Bacteroidota bacterium]|jgi:hypothetical protein
MYVPFDRLPADSRIWVYLSDREWTPSEINSLEASAKVFLEDWTAHQQALCASFNVFYNRFLVIAVDQQAVSASGCSIDKSVAFVKSLEDSLQCRLLERMLFAFKKDGKVNVVDKQRFEELAESGEITDSTIVFDNLVDTLQALGHRWEIPFERSWHKVLVGRRVTSD